MLQDNECKVICFEGIDGCGKSTVIKMLSEYIRKKLNKKVLEVSNIDDESHLGKCIRSIYRDGKMPNSYFSSLLFTAMAVHIKDKIDFLIDEYDYIIVSRNTASTIAYGTDRGSLDSEYNKKVMSLLLHSRSETFEPDMTVLLDCSLEEASRRISIRDHIDGDLWTNSERQKDVYVKFKDIFNNPSIYGYNPDKMMIINNEVSFNSIVDDIHDYDGLTDAIQHKYRYSANDGIDKIIDELKNKNIL